MKKLNLTLALFLLSLTARAGDTYDCINAKGDYYAPAPHPANEPHSNVITIAVDGARTEPRWHAMLSPDDQRDLAFINAGARAYISIER
jgi:hypothetical protein